MRTLLILLLLTVGATSGRAQFCTSSSTQRYQAQATETLRSVSQSTGVPMRALLAANPSLTKPAQVPNATINVPCGQQSGTRQ